MTQEEKEKLRNILYNKKCIADYREEDPFVGIYFSDLIDLLEDYEIIYGHRTIKEVGRDTATQDR